MTEAYIFGWVSCQHGEWKFVPASEGEPEDEAYKWKPVYAAGVPASSEPIGYASPDAIRAMQRGEQTAAIVPASDADEGDVPVYLHPPADGVAPVEAPSNAPVLPPFVGALANLPIHVKDCIREYALAAVRLSAAPEPGSRS